MRGHKVERGRGHGRELEERIGDDGERFISGEWPLIGNII